MKFHLTYRGPLRANDKPAAKQAIREQMAPQLKDLWTRPPLAAQASELLDPDYVLTAIRDVGGSRFSAIVNSNLKLVAEVSVLFLRPEEPGGVVTQRGDIDSRVKTLLDALSIPQPTQVERAPPSPDAGVLPCLFEDDHLITSLAIRTDRLLAPTNDVDVLLVIEVKLSATDGMMRNLSLIT